MADRQLYDDGVTSMSVLRNALAVLVVVSLESCAQPEGGIQSENRWVWYDDYALKPHYRAAAMAWCSSKANYGYIAWSAPTAEAAVNKAIEVCNINTEPRYLQNGTCQLCRISDTDLRGLTQQKIDRAIAIYNTDTSATSYDMVGRANPGRPKKTLEQVNREIEDYYEMNCERRSLRCPRL